MLPLLLPLRLETRFTEAARSLRVRVVPDEPWFDDHDPTIGDGERAVLLDDDGQRSSIIPRTAERAWKQRADRSSRRCRRDTRSP